MAGINSQQVYLPTPDQSETTGAVAIADVGVTPVTDARNQLDARTWEAGGYIDENGISLSISRSWQAIKDWSQSVVRKGLTEFDSTIALNFLQVDEFAAKRMLGEDSVTVDGSKLMLGIGAKSYERIRAWCFSMKDENRRVRVFIPRGQITDFSGEIKFVPGEANIWPCTISTYDDGTGHSIYVIYDDGTVLTDSTTTGD